MGIDKKWHKVQIQIYKDEFPIYKTYSDVLRRILEAACERFAPLSIVQARPKSLSSFAEKAIRKAFKYHSPVTQITDLCGARIITNTLEEAAGISEFIRKYFTIDEANSLDVQTRLKPSEFGYLSVHYVVQTKRKEILGIKIPKEIIDRKAEIQVRTLLQHAWATISHDRVYKNQLKLPEHWRRDLARVAALLEEADGAFGRVVEGLEAYRLNYGAYLTREQIKEEMETLQTILENEPQDENKSAIALRTAKIAKAAWDWEAVVKSLEPFIQVDCREIQEILMEHGHALCQLNKKKTMSRVYSRGQKELEKVSENQGSKIRPQALSYLAWSYGNIHGKEQKTKELYRQSYEADPINPYNLISWLEYEIYCGKDSSFLPLMRQTLLDAIQMCHSHIDVGIELPWAFFTAGKLHLLLGESYESLAAYEKAIHLLTKKDFCCPGDIFDAESEFLTHINFGKQMPPEHRWVSDLLLLAKSAIAPINKDFAISEAAQIAVKNKSFLKPVIIVAGGSSEKIEKEMHEYQGLLAQALDAFEGTIISGGTIEGISGIVGALATKLHIKSKQSLEIIAYLPESLPVHATVDKRYDKLIITEGNDFSPGQPLQYWLDLFASGVPAEEVKVLVINGGQITAFECRLALALGATVGILESSGRAAVDLLQEANWWSEGKLLWLPNDPMAIRAFVNPGKSCISRKQIEKMGKAIHNEFLKENRQKSTDPVMMPWLELREDLKESNRRQAAYAEDVLRRLGYGFRRAKGNIKPLKFKESEVEVMSEMEHGRWIIERLQSGWKYGSKRDSVNKISPFLVPWQDLSEEVKDYDRNAVRNWPALFGKIGLKICKIGKASAYR